MQLSEGDFDDVNRIIKAADKAGHGLKLQLVAKVSASAKDKASAKRKRGGTSGFNGDERGSSDSSDGSGSDGGSDDSEVSEDTEDRDDSDDEEDSRKWIRSKSGKKRRRHGGGSGEDTEDRDDSDDDEDSDDSSNDEKDSSKKGKKDTKGGKKGKKKGKKKAKGSEAKGKKKYENISVEVRIGLQKLAGTEDTEAEDKLVSANTKTIASFVLFEDNVNDTSLIQMHILAWEALRRAGYKAESMVYIAPKKVVRSTRVHHTVLSSPIYSLYATLSIAHCTAALSIALCCCLRLTRDRRPVCGTSAPNLSWTTSSTARSSS
jgi:hypothetical protein